MNNFNFTQVDKDALRLEVLACYGFPDSMEIDLLKYSENLTYLLHDEKTREKYVLRLFRPGYHSAEEMTGELTWIHRIIRETDIKTADVIPGKEGEFVCHMQVGGHPLNCALFEYVEGHSLHDLGEEDRYLYMEKWAKSRQNYTNRLWVGRTQASCGVSHGIWRNW